MNLTILFYSSYGLIKRLSQYNLNRGAAPSVQRTSEEETSEESEQKW